MAKGYVIFAEKVNDADALNDYVQKAVPTVMQAGGRAVVFTPTVEVVEGEWPGQTVIVEFDSVEAAKAWYNSDGYKPLIPERQAAADCNVIICAGV